MTPVELLEKYSGKIVSVGDTFDHLRSSVINETMDAYIARTKSYWQHISDFVIGNHDSRFLEYNKQFNATEFYKNGSVLAFHGHQLWFSFNRKKIKEYEYKWFSFVSEDSLFWDMEEWVLRKFNKYFKLDVAKAKMQAYKNLSVMNKVGQLTDEIDTVITGHTHLAFDVEIIYLGKLYRVINLGSALHEKEFNPVYIEKIDKLFVSDLHLGTAKSILN